MTVKKTKPNFAEIKKANLNDLIRIQNLLRNVILKIKGTGLVYPITKNLSKIDKAIQLKYEELNKIEKQFTFKEENGKEILFKSEMKDGRLVFVLDENKLPIQVPSDYKGDAQPKIDVNDQEYIQAIKKLNTDKFFDEFHAFDDNEIIKLMNNGTFDDVDLTPLIGYLISENI